MTRTILLVDDSKLTMHFTTRALEEAGYQVVCAANIAEMEEQRAAHPPDLILMDVQMPEAYGSDIAMVLRDAREVRVPIYLLSALDEQDLAQRVKEAGIEGYILKRDGLEALIKRVHQIFDEAAAKK